MPKKKDPDFETSLNMLEQLVERMESGEMSLEESLKEFESGIKLVQSCQKSLSEAEQKVQILLDQSETGTPQPFPDPASD